MIRILMPTYYRMEAFGDSFRSILASVSLEQLDQEEIELNIYDNNSPQKMKLLLATLCQRFNGLLNVVLGDENIGKAKALNTFTDRVQPDDVVVSMDSDITISSTGFFRHGIRIVKSFDVCAVSAWQTVNNHHLIEQEWQEAPGGYHYKSHPTGMGIAGGCLFTLGSTWLSVGGYRENRGLFGGNDGCFFYDAGKKTGKPVWVCKELEVVHPPDTDEGYAAWKKEAQEQQMTHSECTHKTGYFESLPPEEPPEEPPATEQG